MADEVYKPSNGSTLSCGVVFNEKSGKGAAQIYEVSESGQKLLAFSTNLKDVADVNNRTHFKSGDATFPDGSVAEEGGQVKFDGKFPYVQFKLEAGFVVDGDKCISPMQNSDAKIVAPVTRSNQM